jgi:FkbM family methyltransferase
MLAKDWARRAIAMSAGNLPPFVGEFGQEQFDAAFDHVAAQGDPFVLQIGAMDGVSYDPVHAAIKRHRAAALLVEPQPEFAALAAEAYQDCPRVRVACCAIAEHDGRASLHRVPPVHVLQGHAPRWVGGIASLYTDRNAIGGVRVPENVAKVIAAHRAALDVPCFRLATLLQQHDIQQIDIVVTDVEGGDWMVLRQLDLRRYRPAMIYFEFLNLPEDDKSAALHWLAAHGYRLFVTPDQGNVLAAID